LVFVERWFFSDLLCWALLDIVDKMVVKKIEVIIITNGLAERWLMMVVIKNGE